MVLKWRRRGGKFARRAEESSLLAEDQCLFGFLPFLDATSALKLSTVSSRNRLKVAGSAGSNCFWHGVLTQEIGPELADLISAGSDVSNRGALMHRCYAILSRTRFGFREGSAAGLAATSAMRYLFADQYLLADHLLATNSTATNHLLVKNHPARCCTCTGGHKPRFLVLGLESSGKTLALQWLASKTQLNPCFDLDLDQDLGWFPMHHIPGKDLGLDVGVLDVFNLSCSDSLWHIMLRDLLRFSVHPRSTRQICSGATAQFEDFAQPCSGLVFFVDSCDKEHFMEARVKLHHAINLFHEVHGRPPAVLVMANKQDRAGSVLPAAIQRALALDDVPTARWRVQGCSATTGRGLHCGFRWLTTETCQGSCNL